MRTADVKLFVRNLFRNKLYSGITVLGFAMALTFVVLLTVYIRQELSVDVFHAHKDRIVRLASEKGSGYSGPMAAMLKEQFPEVEDYCLFMTNKDGLAAVSPTEKIRYTYAYVSPSFFQIFSFPLVQGNPDEVLQGRHSMVISQALAHKLYGNESPVGKEIKIAGVTVPITGIMADMPENTHFPDFDAAVNIKGLTDYWGWPDGDVLESMGIATFSLYVLEKPGADLKAREQDILSSFQKNGSYYGEEDGPKKVVVEPLEQIYFSPYGGGNRKYNSKGLVGVLIAVGSVILMLAIINYINLSIAQGGMRAKEMSVKKLLGSSRKMLFMQYITESVIMCLLAFVIACGLSILAEPLFNQLMNTHIEVMPLFFSWMFLAVLAVIVFIGVISGLVPAWIVTRFNAIEVMKGAFRKKTKGVYSKVLISFQYVVAIALTICTIVLVKQTHFMEYYDMGFKQENIARFSYVLDAAKKETLRNEVLKLAGVRDVAFVQGDPLDGGNNYSFDYEGRHLSFQTFNVDTSFFRMLGLQVTPTGISNVEGREYMRWTMRNGQTERVVLREQSVWLNKEALRQLGLEGLPVEFKVGNHTTSVRGIVNDFHIRDLSQKLEPVMIAPLQGPETPWTMLVQLQGDHQFATFDEIKKVYNQLSEGTPFEATFMDDAIRQWYSRTKRVSGMIGYLCGLDVLLSAIGILAMATYFIQQRIKEIGIRRVNGATIGEVLEMLMNSFIKWIVIAFVIACPIGYYAMNRWMMSFAYRTTIDRWVFDLAGILALCIAGIMICWQSWKAANTNPVEVLKSE